MATATRDHQMVSAKAMALVSEALWPTLSEALHLQLTAPQLWLHMELAASAARLTLTADPPPVIMPTKPITVITAIKPITAIMAIRPITVTRPMVIRERMAATEAGLVVVTAKTEGEAMAAVAVATVIITEEALALCLRTALPTTMPVQPTTMSNQSCPVTVSPKPRLFNCQDLPEIGIVSILANSEDNFL